MWLKCFWKIVVLYILGFVCWVVVDFGRVLLCFLGGFVGLRNGREELIGWFGVVRCLKWKGMC